MLLFPYHLFWTIPLLGLPALKAKKNGRLADRLALNIPEEPLEKGSIWIHALSVGEVLSSVPLVDALIRRFPEKDIVFTSTTSKGMAIARSEMRSKTKALFTMPVDSWWCVRKIVNHINPSIFLLIETDIWPALMACLKGRGIRTLLVNGRISPGTHRAYRSFPPVARLLFKDIDLCLMQTDLDRERLVMAGIDPRKVETVGNIKFDRKWLPMSNRERADLIKDFGLNSNDSIWVAGSTHPGEEEMLLETYLRLKGSFPLLRLIIAPRRIERGEEILGQARNRGIHAALKTENRGFEGPFDVIILNTLGELARVYGLADVSFVGGSMVPFGGHNMLEPASFGCPVVYGTHTQNFLFLAEMLEKSRGGWRVRNKHELFDVMQSLLGDRELSSKSGRKARKFVEENQGAVDRVLDHISAGIT